MSAPGDLVGSFGRTSGRHEPTQARGGRDGLEPAILVIETVSNRAGISLWTREELEEHPILDPE